VRNTHDDPSIDVDTEVAGISTESFETAQKIPSSGAQHTEFHVGVDKKVPVQLTPSDDTI
jgi:hypothetical protein